MLRPTLWLLLLTWLSLTALARSTEPVPETGFTPLTPLPAPKIIRSSDEYPGGNFQVGHIVDARPQSEYASNGEGTDTFIDFDFGRPVVIAGFQHVDRQDPATVDEAELVFSDHPDVGQVTARETIDHENAPGATTVALFDAPHVARFVRWKATKLSAQGHRCVGGRDVRFFTSGPRQPTPQGDQLDVQITQAVQRGDSGPLRPLLVTVHHAYVEPVDATLKVGDLNPVTLQLQCGTQAVPLRVPEVDHERILKVTLDAAGQTIFQQDVKIAPVRHWEFHFLPHSHVDIGFTHVQTEVEQKQWDYLRQAIQIARHTADYPQAARFKWNSEVLWAVDSFLQQASDAEKEEFLRAVRSGVIQLDGLYGNELTALCRPEELMRLCDCARKISDQYNVTVDAAMISDVPGYTWGLVPALVQSGIKYLSIGPNHVHRIGSTLQQWGDRPFYWVSPSGDERLLCWMAGKAYSWFHPSRVGALTRDSQHDPFFEYLDELLAKDYPYAIIQIRYSIGGDNGPPDQELSEFVKAWNEQYLWPRMEISTTSRLMHELEDRYGDRIPHVRGDFTPYWEDGAGSSARETALARGAAERLVQAETLWAMLAPKKYPADQFYAAWRNVLLYNEHTWGAHCSISQPESPFTLGQWKIKQAFAVDARRQSQALLDAALESAVSISDKVDAVDVWNTHSWSRTDLVTLETETPLIGYVVQDLQGNVVPSMVTPRGYLAFLATDVPPLSAKRFVLQEGMPENAGAARAEGYVISNKTLRLEVDPETGAIASFRCQGIPTDLADQQLRGGLNQYCYVAGRRGDQPAASRVTRTEVLVDQGLTASLAVFASGSGVRQLITILRVTDGLDRVDIINTLDKKKVLEKESVHFGFPFQVPGGTMRVNTPWAVVQPNSGQLAGACKNYVTVGRWVDVSNDDFGVTWTTLDAPLIEIGGIHVDVPEPFQAAAWIQQLEPTQTLYSYVMNNYWETNYKASQEGMTSFQYALLPHGKYDQAAAARFAVERSQPLIVRPARREAALPVSPLRVTGEGVVVTSLKPSEDRNALMVRLFNTGDQPATAELAWPVPTPARITWSSPREESGRPLEGPIHLPALGIVTLRVSR